MPGDGSCADLTGPFPCCFFSTTSDSLPWLSGHHGGSTSLSYSLINFFLFKLTRVYFSWQLIILCHCLRLERKGQRDLLPMSEKH